MKRIHSLVITNGWAFTFQYLKESLRLCVQSLGGVPDLNNFNGCLVRRDSHGIPKIIPLRLRVAFRGDHDLNRSIIRLVLMLVSVFRIFPTLPKPDIGSIIDPFSGIGQTLLNEEVALALKRLKVRNIGFRPLKGFISESAGPNGKIATWTCGFDAFAFILYPSYYFHFCKIAFITRSYGYFL